MGEYFDTFLERMQQSYQAMAGMRADDASDIGIRFKILAEQLERLSEELEEAKKQAFAKTATGESLQLHAMQRGIIRKPAIFAKGEAEFTRESPASENIIIPQGTLLTCEGMQGVQFKTTEEAVLLKGEKGKNVKVICKEAGERGNLASGQLTVMITPVAGITKVTNPQPIVGGEDAENDENLRRRLMDSYRFVTNGTNTAFYYNKAMSYPGVSSAKVLPRINGVGTVGIVIYGIGVDDALIEKMKQEIGEVKEINVDLSIEKAVEKPVSIEIEVAAADGYSYEDVSGKCRLAIERYLKKQEIGKPLYQALLIRELLSCEGVANGKIVAPAADLYPLDKEVYTLSGCTVRQMQRQ